LSTANREDTIAAISTPMGNGGIGIIRISGPEAFSICKELFRASLSVSKEDSARIFDILPSHSLKHGFAVDPESGEVLDECLFGKMAAPTTYTCEDVAEINCHGGPAVMKAILQAVFQAGARPAEPGEFTKRAFLGGRIDLTAAEGVMDIIKAETEMSRKAAVEQLDGRLARELKAIRRRLTESIGEIEVALEYPEYDMDTPAYNHTEQTLNEIIETLKAFSASYGRGKLLRDGLKVVIAGRPNAGKSSLLNFLTGRDRAIVTDIPGTTRDTLEEFTEIDGYPVIFTDTAGLRESSDAVEKIGVDRARNEIKNADLVLYVVDSSDENWDQPEFNKGIVLINKTDRATDGQLEKCRSFYGNYRQLEISLYRKEGLTAVFEAVKTAFEKGSRQGVSGGMILTNLRHKQLVDKAEEVLERGLSQYRSGMPLDCITYDMWQCAGFLGEITGEAVSDEIIDSIFERFCLGK
jgi:tRNA modification GTPase